MRPLPKEDWHKLSQSQRWALEILAQSRDAEVEPECPLSIKTAMHDLWRFGFADRRFKPLRYSVTFLGQRAAHELKLSIKPQHAPESTK